MPEGGSAAVNAIEVFPRLPARHIYWAWDDSGGIERPSQLVLVSRWERAYYLVCTMRTLLQLKAAEGEERSWEIQRGVRVVCARNENNQCGLQS